MDDKQTHQGRKTDRSNNTLNGSRKFALWQELVKAKGELEAALATYEDAAAMMTQRLGFTVTKANIADAVQQKIVSWRRPSRGGNNAGAATASRIADLESRVAALEDVVLRLCGSAGVSSDGIPQKPGEAWVSK
jgi:hypothetical protein